MFEANFIQVVKKKFSIVDYMGNMDNDWGLAKIHDYNFTGDHTIQMMIVRECSGNDNFLR